MRLVQLENEFQAFVLEGAPQIARSIVGTGRVPVDTRLDIYAQAYGARLTEALESNYPLLAKLLGGEQFALLAAAYRQYRRPAHFSIRWHGDRLSAWLAGQPPYDRRPLLAELARWEWSMTLAFDAADAPPLRRAALAAVAPERWSDLCFRLHPSVQVLALRTAAAAVWRALDRGEAPPAQALAPDVPAATASATIAAAQSPAQETHWFIWRRGLETIFRSATAFEAAALAALARGDSFGSLCERLASEVGEDEAPGRAAALLARWMEDEMLAA